MRHPLALSLAILAVTGCNAPRLIGGGGGGGGDLGAATPTPTPHTTPVPQGAYVGYVGAGHSRVENPGGAPTETAFAGGQFFAPIPGYAPIAGSGYPAADQCWTGPAHGDAPTAAKDAGAEIDLAGGADIVMPRDPNGGWPIYLAGSLDLAAVPEGATIAVSWPGAANGIPAESYPGVLTIPSRLRIVAPDVSQTVPLGGSLSLTWSGTSVDPAILVIVTTTATGAQGVVLCSVTDDGSFTVPAETIAALPPQSHGSLSMTRVSIQSRTLPDGTVVWFDGSWGDSASVTVP